MKSNGKVWYRLIISAPHVERKKRKERVRTVLVAVLFVGALVVGLLVGKSAEKRSRDPGSWTTPRVAEAILERPRGVYEDSLQVVRTAYNPIPGQTDGSPCVGAAGRNVCRILRQGIRVIATSPDLNLPFGTKVAIEGVTYHVWDRMPSRWVRSVDVLTLSVVEARRMGRKSVVMNVLR